MGDFYPRPPRGGRQSFRLRRSTSFLFLSTPSARRATRTRMSVLVVYQNFYPRPPRGGRHNRSCVMDHLNFISIHALREEGDSRQLWMALPSMISIHALREEGDVFPAGDSPLANDFYPRPPRGGRRAARIAAYKGWVFLSTPSARRATSKTCCPLRLV